MDEAALAKAEEDLVAWGLLERSEAGLSWSRRFRAAVMREAARLAEEERAGRRPAGAPLATAVEGALRALPLPEGAAAGSTHAKLLYAVELAALPDAVRAIVGA